MKDSITDILLLISNSLLIPVIILLLFFFVFMIMNLGGLVSEYFERVRKTRAFQQRYKIPFDHIFRQTNEFLSLNSLTAKSLSLFQEEPSDASHILDNLQIKYEEQLMMLNIGIRLGPVLGLAGTLIPLGPALMSLSDGDINSLSQNLVVAFTTTVIGLFVGGTSYIVYAIRSRWYLRDVNNLEYFFNKNTTGKGKA